MELDPRNSRPAVTELSEEQENLISAIALGKVLAFLAYSFLALFLSLAIVTVIHAKAPHLDKELLVFILLASSEVLLLFLVIKGWLPATSGATALPFSEKQAAWGFAVVSFVPWAFRADPTWLVVFAWLFNGMLFLVAIVFFVVKSVLTKRLRYEVLAIAVIPAIQLYAANVAA